MIYAFWIKTNDSVTANMILIPCNHTDAMNWINRAWYELGLTPAQTSELLAKICGFESWQLLSESITEQYYNDFSIKEFHSLSWEYIESKIDSKLALEIKDQQITVMKASVSDPSVVLNQAMDILSILHIPSISTSERLLPKPLIEILQMIVKINVVELEGHEGDGEMFVNKTEPIRYFDFSKAMGWKVDEASFKLGEHPFDAKFELLSRNGRPVPVFLSQRASPHFEGLENLMKSIHALSQGKGWSRAILLFGNRAELTTPAGKIVTVVGMMFYVDESFYAMMIVNKLTKTVESLIDINQKFVSVSSSGVPEFAADTGRYVSGIYDEFINSDD